MKKKVTDLTKLANKGLDAVETTLEVVERGQWLFGKVKALLAPEKPKNKGSEG